MSFSFTWNENYRGLGEGTAKMNLMWSTHTRLPRVVWLPGRFSGFPDQPGSTRPCALSSRGSRDMWTRIMWSFLRILICWHRVVVKIRQRQLVWRRTQYILFDNHSLKGCSPVDVQECGREKDSESEREHPIWRRIRSVEICSTILPSAALNRDFYWPPGESVVCKWSVNSWPNAIFSHESPEWKKEKISVLHSGIVGRTIAAANV